MSEVKVSWRNNASKSKLLDDLNDEQRAVVEKTDGYVLVLAGAGAGKTRALTYKVAYLLEQGLAEPHNILAVTFTNKAAGEMKERIMSLVSNVGKAKWWIGTFHGICVRILVQYGKEIGIPSFFTIADEKEQQKEMKAIIESHPESNIEVEKLQDIISWAKNNLVRPNDLMVKNQWGVDPLIGQMYGEYQERLQKMNTLDFDDLIMRTIDLFNLVPEVRERFQNQFKYIACDEGQDLNPTQYELLRILSDKHKNLTIIGDVDQNIYSWRGASLDVVMAFSKLPETTVMKLEQNYRCTKTIVEASNEVVKKNKQRLDKTLWTANDDGDKIIYYRADTEYEEAKFVAGVIDYCCNIKRTNDYKDFAVLYRTNSQSRVLEDELSALFIPYQIVGGMSFYERKEVKDMLAYIRILVNPNDILSFQRIANEPKRGVGEVALKSIIDFIHEHDISVIEALDKVEEIKKPNGKSAITAKAKEALREMNKVMKHFRGQMATITPARLIKDYAVAIGYLPMLEADNDKERILNVYELANMADAWYEKADKEEFTNCLEDFVRQLNLVTDTDTVADDENVVKLMTVHTAKG